MLLLTATTHSLEVLLGSTPTTELAWTTHYVAVTSTTYTPTSENGVTTGTTAQTIVTAPGDASTQKQVKYITIYNNNASDVVVIVQKNVNGTKYYSCNVTLNSGDTLQYTDTEGFSVLAPTGGLKNSGIPLPVISAGTQSASSGTMSLVNSNGLTWGISVATSTQSNTVTASISRTLSASFWEVPWAKYYLSSIALTNSTSALNFSLQRVYVPYDMTITRLDNLVVMSEAASQSGTWSISVGVYTRTQSTLNSASSTASGVNWASLGATNNTNSYNGISGTRWRSLAPNNWAFTPGEYWFGFLYTATGAGAASIASLQVAGQSAIAIGGIPGGDDDVIGNDGLFASATPSLPSTVNIVNDIIYCSAGAANTNIWRQPYFRMFGSY